VNKVSEQFPDSFRRANNKR